MDINEKIKSLAREFFPDMVDIRSYLHKNPELSDHEYETSEYLKNICKELGLVVEEVKNSTGFTALLDTKRKGKTIGFRTDIDALPIQENPRNLVKEKEVISQKPHIMHACGHDSHMAILIGTIKILSSLKDKLSGKIYFIFEEGEETGGGYEQMVDHLKDKGLDYIFANHIWPDYPTGKIMMKKGPVLAGCADLNFDILGRGGHGSRPDLCINPLTAACNIVTGLTSAWVNQIDISKTVTLGISAINGGSANNVIPDICNIKGSLRYFDPDTGKKALQVFNKVVETTSLAHLCKVKYYDDHKIAVPPTINDDDLADLYTSSVGEIMDGGVFEDEALYVSESFSHYSQIAKTCLALIGTKNETFGSGASLHNSCFDLDPESLYYGAVASSRFAYELLKTND
ncbi:MAG: amidohydrolase [Finegoldia sp.]|nr:amidohydrolase [Finegoldia sp.]